MDQSITMACTICESSAYLRRVRAAPAAVSSIYHDAFLCVPPVMGLPTVCDASWL